MRNGWALGQDREIFAANFNNYKNPELHPNRIMQQHDLVYMLEGSWCIGQDDKSYEVGPGDVIVLQAKYHHYGIQTCEPKTRTMFIHFSPLEGDCLFQSNNTQDTELLWTDTVIRCGNGTSTKWIFEEIIETFWSNLNHKSYCMSTLLSLLLWKLSIQSKESINYSDLMIDEVLHRIKRNPERFFSIQELARSSFVSAKTMTSRFKKMTGRSIHQYQLELKLDMVYMQMQTEPNKSLKELSANFGFYDEFHLSKLFKRKFGVSPSTYLHK